MEAGNKELLGRLKKATQEASGNVLAQETLNFALGMNFALTLGQTNTLLTTLKL